MLRLRNISEITMTTMVMEMRKLDRDRERIIHPSTLDNLIQKYKLPITPCVPRLNEKFQDKNYPGFTMYQSYKQFQGYIPPKEVVQLALAYSTVFHLGLDQAGIQGAIYTASASGMVNIDTFIQAVLDYIM